MSESAADCVFCRIAAHEAVATIRSVAELADVDLAGRLVLAAARIARDAGVTTFRLATNSGAPLQDVFHLHGHVMAGGAMGHPAGIAFSRRT